jgi:hypothetical protein
LRAAKAWGLTPREWRAESVDDRALMLSFILFEGMIEARRCAWREERREREEKRRGGRDENTFSKMKDRLRGKT